MSESVAPSRTCRFPGCERPAAPAEEGVGRPPEYCQDPTHNRGAAWRARRAMAAVTAGRAVPDDLDRPVSMARARAGEYAERVAAQVETLTATLGAVVAELRTLGDPDAAAVQLDAHRATRPGRRRAGVRRATRPGRAHRDDRRAGRRPATRRGRTSPHPDPAGRPTRRATKTGSPSSAPKSTRSARRTPGELLSQWCSTPITRRRYPVPPA